MEEGEIRNDSVGAKALSQLIAKAESDRTALLQARGKHKHLSKQDKV